MPAINKTLFLGLIFGPYALQWVVSLASLAMTFSGNSDLVMVGGGLSCFALLLIIPTIVMVAILVYKLWETIQGGKARTTPGKACGFLFIPLFNLYWIFVAYWGWAQDFNAYVRDKGVGAPEVSETIALVLCIAVIVSIPLSLIPFVGLFFGLINAVLLFLFFTRAIDGANAVRAGMPPVASPAL